MGLAGSGEPDARRGGIGGCRPGRRGYSGAGGTGAFAAGIQETVAPHGNQDIYEIRASGGVGGAAGNDRLRGLRRETLRWRLRECGRCGD